MGKRKISIEKLEDKEKRNVTFSKRRKGLFHKTFELSSLCKAKTAIVLFSPAGTPFMFVSNASSVDDVVDCYLKHTNSGESEKKKKMGSTHDQWRQASSVKNRTKGLKKKLHELTTLCDIEGFMVILPEPQQVKDQSSSVEPIIWPENQGEILHHIKRFKSTVPGKRRVCSDSDMGFKEYQKEAALSREQGRPAKKPKIWPHEGFSYLAMDVDSLNRLPQGPETVVRDGIQQCFSSTTNNFDMNGFETRMEEYFGHQIMPLPAGCSCHCLPDAQVFCPSSYCIQSEEEINDNSLIKLPELREYTCSQLCDSSSPFAYEDMIDFFADVPDVALWFDSSVMV